jgi:hypothetical protein
MWGATPNFNPEPKTVSEPSTQNPEPRTAGSGEAK